MIDTHSHLYLKNFSFDFDAVLERALQKNIKTIINIGTDLSTSQQALNLNSTKPDFYSTIGLHPHEAYKFDSEEKIVAAIKSLTNLYYHGKEKIVGLGECGLDYHFQGSSDFVPTYLPSNQLVILQKKLFKSQINLAKSLKIPLVIHCRESWQDIFTSELSGSKGVFHNFSSGLEDAQKALKMGFYLSFSCIITYHKNDHLRKLIEELPLDKILTETDCPFLPPQLIRGQRNEPCNIFEVVKTISEIKKISFDQVADTTSTNAKVLFDIK